MDPVTAKTLVSAALVFSIALFSFVSMEGLFQQVRLDLRAVRASRGGTPNRDR